MEPGYGERREEALKMASIKTFFIIKAIKPVIIIIFFIEKLIVTHSTFARPIKSYTMLFCSMCTLIVVRIVQFKLDTRNGSSMNGQHSASKESVVGTLVWLPILHDYNIWIDFNKLNFA